MADRVTAAEPRRNGIQVVARVADVLRALADAPEGLSLSELAHAVTMPKSTVHRLVSALESEEFVTPARAGKLHLGHGIARLGAATRAGIRDQIRPYLLRLHQELEETVDLSVNEMSSARFIDHIPAPHRLRAVSAVGATFPLHCTANGKVFLAVVSADNGALEAQPTIPDTLDHTSNVVTWAPDNRSMVLSDIRTGTPNIWSLPVLGNAPERQLTHLTSGQIWAFHYTRDGKSVAYARGNNQSDVVLFTSAK